MKSQFHLTNMDHMEATLSVTLTLAEWKQLVTQLETIPPSVAGYPVTIFNEDIRMMIFKVTRELSTAEISGQTLR